MNTAYFYLTDEGGKLAHKLAAAHPGDIYNKENFKENLRAGFGRYDSLVCIMATGIVVRILAPLIVHKTSDPAVVVLDQKGKYAISLLSGHLGGANDLAREMAVISDGEAVITTATDVAGELSFDTFAKKHDMAIENIGQLKHISGALLSGKKVNVFTDKNAAELYPELAKEQKRGMIAILPLSEFFKTYAIESNIPAVVIDERLFVSNSTVPQAAPVLYLRPRTICAGIGCKRNMEQKPIEEALLQTLKEEGIHPFSLKCIATIPLKSDEPGIIGTAANLNVPLQIIYFQSEWNMPDDYWNREIPVLQKFLLLSAIKIPVTSAKYSRNIMESPLSYADNQTMKLTVL